MNKQYLFKDRVYRKFCLWVAKEARFILEQRGKVPRKESLNALKVAGDYIKGIVGIDALKKAKLEAEEVVREYAGIRDHELQWHFAALASASCYWRGPDAANNCSYQYTQMAAWGYRYGRDMWENQTGTLSTCFNRFLVFLSEEEYDDGKSETPV